MPKVFRGREDPEIDQKPQLKPKASPKPSSNGNKQGLLKRLESLKTQWNEDKKDLKQQIKQAVGDEKKDLKKTRKQKKVAFSLKFSKEIADSSKWIPVVGDLFQKAQKDSEMRMILFHGINEKGEIVPKDEKGKQALSRFLKSQGHYLRAVFSTATLVVTPEVALAAKAAQGSKLAKAGRWAFKAKKANELAQDINVVSGAVKDLRNREGEVDWGTAAELAPGLLEHGLAKRYEKKGNHSKAATARFAARFMRRLPKKETIAAVKQVPESKDSQIAQDIHALAKEITPDIKSGEYSNLPLAA